MMERDQTPDSKGASENEEVNRLVDGASHIKPMEKSPESTPKQVQDILDIARADTVTPIKKVESSADLHEYDPISGRQNNEMNSDNGVSIVHSFVNRTVFFDYFRHVANKRFPHLSADARVEELIGKETKFYNRSILSDYALKASTSMAIIVIAVMIVYKALFV